MKLIAGADRGLANVDLEKADEPGIVVCTTGRSRGRGNSTAERAWALLLGVTRHIALQDTRDARRQVADAFGGGFGG